MAEVIPFFSVGVSFIKGTGMRVALCFHHSGEKEITSVHLPLSLARSLGQSILAAADTVEAAGEKWTVEKPES